MADSEEVTTQNTTVANWTRALAESVGTPGGGAGAGVMLAEELDSILDRAQQLRRTALQLADDDAAASHAFGAAFKLERGPERTEAIRSAAVGAAQSSAVLGEHAITAITDLSWLAQNGNPALISDVVVAFGALRATLTGARTNVSFDLATLRSSGSTLEAVQQHHPELWASVERLDSATTRIDEAALAVDARAAPTDSH